MKKLLVFLMALMVMGLTGCIADEEEVDIYTTIYPVEFLVKEIVGERFVVRSIYPRGKDVHDYESNPKDLIKMSKSKIIFYLGLGLESFVERAKDSSFKNVPTVAISKGLSVVLLNDDQLRTEIYDGTNTEEYDTHVWLDPIRMKQLADNVYNSLIEHLELSTDDVDMFTANLLTLKSELNQLDLEFRGLIGNTEYKNTTIMVDHDAYVYWTLAYQINRIKMRHHNESSDVVPQDMQQKINLAKSLGIKHILTTMHEAESSILGQYLTALGLTESAKVPIHHLGTITDQEAQNNDDYFTLMRYNLQVLKNVFPKNSN